MEEYIGNPDKDGDGVVESHEIPDWKKRLTSVFRGADGAYSSKRVAAFSALITAIISTFLIGDVGIITVWLGFAAGLWGFALGERPNGRD
jgi:uncharacterized membrane protein